MRNLPTPGPSLTFWNKIPLSVSETTYSRIMKWMRHWDWSICLDVTTACLWSHGTNGQRMENDADKRKRKRRGKWGEKFTDLRETGAMTLSSDTYSHNTPCS